MRYLNKREDFLKQKKHIKGVPYETLLEVTSSAGPFANDVGWNDSLLGRLINHAIRKARIAAKVPTIKRLIDRLKIEFDQIVGQSTVFSLEEEDQILKIRIEISEFFKKLIEAVEAGEPVSTLKGLTDGCIDKVTSMKIFDKKDVLLAELKKFRDFLDQFKEDDTQDDEKEEEVKPTTVNTQEIPFDFCIKNLKAVYAILVAYRKLKDSNKQEHFAKKDATGQEVEIGKEYTYNNKVVKVVNKDHTQVASTDKAWLTKDDKIGEPLQNPKKDVFIIWQLGDKNYPPNTTGQAVDSTKLKPLTESNEVVTPTPATVAPTNTSPVKEASILSAVKPVYTYFTSDKDIFPGLESLFKMSPENQQKYGFKAPILKIYNTVRLNEDLKQFLSRPEAIGKALITMYKSTKVKEDGSFEGIQDDMKLAIADFNKTMKAILQFQSGIGEKPKKEGDVETKSEETKPVETQAKKEDDIDFENKNRSDFNSVKLLKYNSFMRINEADEPVQTQTQSEDTVQGTQSQATSDETVYSSEKVIEFFNQNCKEVRAFTVSDEEKEALNKKMEESEKNNKGIIMSMDPIIEIMKLFIKAYKTYTVLTITKRTEKVDTNTLSEYTSFGAASGDDTGRQGPYRNNKLFDLWENAVNDIRKDRKYQAVFTENANLRLPKVTDPDPTKKEDWVIKPKAGIAFRQFINDVLDGDKLYKSSSTTGAVATFIEKYFGDGSVSQTAANSLQSPELTDAGKIADEIDKNSIKLKLKEVTAINPVANTFFTITGMKPGDATKPDIFDKPVQRSFFIDKNDGISVFMVSSIFINQFNTLLTKLGPARVISKGDFVSSLSGTATGIEVTKISKADFIKLKKDQKIKMVTLDKTGAQHTENIKIDNIYSLIKEDDSKLYTLSDEERTKFNPILKGTGIVDTDDKNAVENKVKNKVGTIITPI